MHGCEAGGLGKRLIQAVVDVAKLDKLHVGELDDIAS